MQQQVQQNTTEQNSYFANKPLMQTIITRKKKLFMLKHYLKGYVINCKNDLSSHAIFTFIYGNQ